VGFSFLCTDYSRSEWFYAQDQGRCAENGKKCVFVQKSSSANLDAPRRAAYDAQVLLVNERGETCEQRFG